MEDALRGDGKQFVVVPVDSLIGIEMLYNSPHPERYRLLEDPNIVPANMYIAMNKGLGISLPMHLWNAHDLKEHARETALINFSEDAIISIQRLGLTVQLRPAGPLRMLYLR
jgi:hypothetical protein